MSTVLPGWSHFTHYVEDGKYLQNLANLPHCMQCIPLVLETIKDDKDLFSDCSFVLYQCSNHATATNSGKRQCFKCLRLVTRKNMQLA